MTPTPHRPLLARLKGATKSYGAVRALTDLDLQVHAGEVLAVLGANGAGKSTALGLLTGRLSADSGAVEVLGGDPRDARRRRGLGVMLQEGSLPDVVRVAEHVALFSTYYPSPRPLAQTLDLAGLSALADRPYGALSGGERRRVQFALAICGRPALLFVDEPTVGLDPEARRRFWAVLGALRAEGVGLVLTTHYLEEADALADRVAVLAHGRLLVEDTPTGIKQRAAGKRVRAKSAVPLATITGWPEVREAVAADGVVQVSCHDAEQVLRRWLALDPHLSELEVGALSLEEAFVSLTGASA